MRAIAAAVASQNKAAAAGFDWSDPDETVEKLLEEISEYQAGDASERKEEVGDILFVAVSLARTTGIHPETALSNANKKFSRRWAMMHRLASEQGQKLADLPLSDKKKLWQQAKSRIASPPTEQSPAREMPRPAKAAE